MKKSVVFLSLIAFSFSITAQDLPGKKGQVIVFPEENGFRFIDEKSDYYTENGIDFVVKPRDYRLEDYRLRQVRHPNRTLFTAVGGGLVYEFKDDKLQRLDNSFFFKSRFSAFNFTKGDTIVSVSGSGEFNVQNNIIYFTENIKEWLVETRIPYISEANNIPIGQYDTETNKVFFNLPKPKVIDGKARFEVQTCFPSLVYSYDFGTKAFEAEFDLSELFEEFFPNQLEPRLNGFHLYNSPMLYNTDEIWSFDFQTGMAYRHVDANRNTLIQYTKILSYNHKTNDFLLVYGEKDEAKYLVMDETLLLGQTYESYPLKQVSAGWPIYLYFLPLLFIPLLIRKKKVSLIEGIESVETDLKKVLSSEDFRIYELIKEAYPKGVEYPDLQSAFERDLSYESRIKKLRTTIASIDELIQSLLRRKGKSVFLITKGKEDKRVKVIRIKQDEVLEFWWKNKRKSR
jgi:hypothetical protein